MYLEIESVPECERVAANMLAFDSASMLLLKILVAEDDRLLARYYEMLLTQWNCETVVERTGTDAICRAATFGPDVALLGVVIPEMGGVEAAFKLLEICPGTKIVLVTERFRPRR